MEIEIAVANATSPLQNQLVDLQNKINNADTEKSLLEKTLQEKHQIELKAKDQIIQMKDDEIELRKDMKLKLSTKMLGETLEQHCELQFNRLRSTAFQEHILRKIMTHQREQKVITFSRDRLQWRRIHLNHV